MKFPMNRPFCSVAVLTMLGALPAVAMAGDGPYLGVEGGYNYQNPQNLKTDPSTGLSNKFDAGFVGGLTLGYASKFGFRPELELDYRRNDIRKLVTPLGNTTDVSGFNNAYTGFANLWYDVKTPTGLFSVVHPYIGGGVGVARAGIRNFEVGGVQQIKDFDTVFAYQGGAGVGVDLTRNLTASVDLRYVETERGDYDAGGTNIRARYRASSALLGVRYSFGGPEPEPARAAPPPPPVAAYVPPPPPPPVDGDDDHDGVPNSRDKCPGTPRGFKVDADGCIIEQTVVLRAVNFEFNSDRLTQPAQETLDEVGSALVGQPTLNVQIGGYTDSKGSDAYNLNLSAKRAKAVKTYLVGKGVKADNLVSKGFGEASPTASNDTEEGRAENRRVEFVVLNKPATVKVLTKDSSKASKAAAEGTEPKPRKKK